MVGQDPKGLIPAIGPSHFGKIGPGIEEGPQDATQ